MKNQGGRVKLLLIVLICSIGLIGAPVVHATSIISFEFEFKFGGETTGIGWYKINVDPNDLPFDSWMNFEDFTVYQQEFVFYTEGGDYFNNMRSTGSFSDSRLTMTDSTFLITDDNPIFTLDFANSTVTDDHSTSTIHVLNGYNEYHAADHYLTIGDHGGYRRSATGGGTIELGTWTASVWFDDPPMATIPEPATLLLFSTGIASLAGFRLRKRKER